MKKNLKILIGLILILIVLYCIIFFIDYSRCKHFKQPIFVVPGITADDGGSGTYYGLGYKVKIEKTISVEYGPTLVKVEMYMFNKFIIGAIADVESSIDKNCKTKEEEYEFTATVIGVYDNSIIVEPDANSNERKSSDKISMGINEQDSFYIGSEVRITYNGIIMESYPAQIIATKIEILK